MEKTYITQESASDLALLSKNPMSPEGDPTYAVILLLNLRYSIYYTGIYFQKSKLGKIMLEAVRPTVQHNLVYLCGGLLKTLITFGKEENHC